jgi:hypothetical protein
MLAVFENMFRIGNNLIWYNFLLEKRCGQNEAVDAKVCKLIRIAWTKVIFGLYFGIGYVELKSFIYC